MSGKLRIYGDSRSGNCYKLTLACAELGREYDWEEIDILAGGTRTPEFLAMNPNGRIPLAALPDGRYLPESNAILSYLADGTPLGGTDAWSRAEILQWLFFEQYSHEPNIATSRFIIQYLGNPPEKKALLEEKRLGGYRALDVLEGQLRGRAYITGDTYTIADIGLFAYTHVADEGGFDLGSYPNIRRWIERILQRDRFVPMQTGPE